MPWTIMANGSASLPFRLARGTLGVAYGKVVKVWLFKCFFYEKVLN